MPLLEGPGSCADIAPVLTRLRTRLRAQHGFGLTELLVAMFMLNIGLLALLASFSSAAVTLRRASKVSTASALASAHMERYRAITYESIRLDAASIPTSAPYTADTAYSVTQVTTPPCPGPPDECNASRTTTGADGRDYRVDTYIVYEVPTSGRQLKKVTVVIRDSTDLMGRPLTRQVSTFDESA